MRAALAHPNTRQFLKFALVGFASLAVEYLFLGYFLQALSMDYLLATTIAFIISIVVNYILSMKYVFSHKENMSRKREFTIFAVLSAIGLGLNDLYMFIGVSLLNVGTMAMKLISTFFVTWYNYFSRRKFLDAGRG
ncbi:MAG: GtrA family protein [Collinsella stercoris]|nr:GtrA family protein [Collinsella stercoris]